MIIPEKHTRQRSGKHDSANDSTEVDDMQSNMKDRRKSRDVVANISSCHHYDSMMNSKSRIFNLYRRGS